MCSQAHLPTHMARTGWSARACIRRRVARISWMPETESKIQLSLASGYKQFSWSRLSESGSCDLNLAMPATSMWIWILNRAKGSLWSRCKLYHQGPKMAVKSSLRCCKIHLLSKLAVDAKDYYCCCCLYGNLRVKLSMDQRSMMALVTYLQP